MIIRLSRVLVRQFWLLPIPLLAVLWGCDQAKETVADDGSMDSYSESSGQAEELISEYPAYDEAKTAMTRQQWDEAAAILQNLLAEGHSPAPFANDLGIVEMRRNRLDSAERAFLQAIELNPEYERAWYNLGVLRRQQDEIDAAESAYRQAVQINPFYFEAQYNLGLLLYQSGRLDEAETTFRSILENTRSARFSRVYYQMGMISADKGDDPAAVGFYDESLLLNPSHVPSYLNKAAALIRLHLPGKAREALQDALKLDPDDSRIYWNIGLSYLDEENDPEARDAFEKTIALAPDYAPAYINLATIAIRAGRPQNAQAYLEAARDLDPSNSAVFWNLGLIAADAGDDEKAIELFTHTLRLDPANPDAYLNLAAAMMRQRQFAAALESLDKMTELAPQDHRIYWNQGLIAMEQGQNELAYQKFSQVLELQKDYPPALFNLGLSEYRAENRNKAREFFHRAAYANPDVGYPEAHYMLGKTYSEQDNFNAAINEYEIALRLRPDYMEAAFNMALNLEAAGDLDASIEIYIELAKQPDAPPEALNNLAAHWIGEDEPSRAVTLLERALESDGTYITAAYNLGLAKLRLKDYHAAVRALEKAVTLDPSYFSAWKNLGIAHARLEDFESALVAMQKAFDLHPYDADTAVYVVKYLKILEKPEGLITQVYERSYETGARNPLMLRHLAAAAFDKEAYARSAQYYEEYIKLRPSPTYIYNLGLARLRNHQYALAADAFAEAARLGPDNFAYWKNLGISYSRMENYDAALQAMEKAFHLDPSDAETAVYVVKYLKLLDRSEAEVTRVYKKAYAAGSRDTMILRHLARTAYDEGDFAQAAALYNEYLELRPSAVYTYNRGLALLQDEQFELAIEAFSEATELDPENFAFWKNLGIAYSRLEQYEAAMSAMQSAFERNPADAETSVYLVKYMKLFDRPESEITDIYQTAYTAGARHTLQLRHLARDANDREDFDTAARFYKEYLELRPSPVYYYNYGLTLRKAERFEEAREAYMNAVAMDPSYEKAWLNLGYIHAFLGDGKQAAEAFNKALEIDPDYMNAIDALDKLKAGEIKP